MWRFLIIGLIGLVVLAIVLAIVRSLIITLDVNEQLHRLPSIGAGVSFDVRDQVAGKAREFSLSVSQLLWEGRGLCILIAGLGGLSLWTIIRRIAPSRRDLLGVGLRIAVFGGLLGLWLWQTSPFLQSVSNNQMLGIASPGRELLLLPLLQWELPVIASSWILLLLAVGLVLDWSLLPFGSLSRRPEAPSIPTPVRLPEDKYQPCTRCGYQNIAGTRFCLKCGLGLEPNFAEERSSVTTH